MKAFGIVYFGVFLLTGIHTPSTAYAQEPVVRDPGRARVSPQRLETTEIRIIRGEGEPPPVTDSGPADRPPAEWTIAEKAALVAGLGQIVVDIGPWRVTPGEPSIPDRAWLAFANPSSIRTYSVNPQATMTGTSSAAFFDDLSENAHVGLHFQPPALGLYLVDCLVKKYGANNWHRVRVYPGGAEQTFSETGHVYLIYEAVSITPAYFKIWTEGTGMVDWRFLSCEITPMK